MGKRTYIECQCHTHLLVVEQEDEEPRGYDICFYEYGHPEGKWSWKSRLRCIWQVIRKGHPYADAVCLDRDEADRLIEALSEGRDEDK